jgi:hypothetical protein
MIKLTWYPNGSCYGHKNYNVSASKGGRYIVTVIATHCHDGERLVYKGAYRPDPKREVVPESSVDPSIVSEVRQFAESFPPSGWDDPNKKFGWDEDDIYDDLVVLGKIAEEVHGKDAGLATYEYLETVREFREP